MTRGELLDPETLESFDRAFGEILDAVPRARKMLIFHAASYVEGVAKSAIRALRDEQAHPVDS